MVTVVVIDDVMQDCGTVLHKAARLYSGSAVPKLVKAGFDVNAQDEVCCTVSVQPGFMFMLD